MAILTVSGNVGHCSFSYSEAGTAVLALSVADKRWNYKTKEEETYWIRAIWFGERAEKLVNSVQKAKIISITGLEAYKIYDGKIDRTLEPLDHTILQFKAQDGEPHENRNVNSNINPYEFPPPSNQDIPYSR